MPCILRCRDDLSHKQFVLEDFFELSESPIHFSNASRRSLSIPDEFGEEYYRNTIGISKGIFFCLDHRIRFPFFSQFVESALEWLCVSRNECQGVLQTSIVPDSRTAFLCYIIKQPYTDFYTDRIIKSRKINCTVISPRIFDEIPAINEQYRQWSVSIENPIETRCRR